MPNAAFLIALLLFTAGCQSTKPVDPKPVPTNNLFQWRYEQAP